MGIDGDDTESVQEELEWQAEQQLEMEENPPIDFSYYYDITTINDFQGSFTWNEMSYRHETTSWDALEKTDWELFEQDGYE